MNSPAGLAASPLGCLADLAERRFASPQESIRAALDAARTLTGHCGALLVERSGGAWTVIAVRGEAFGFAPGNMFPLDDLLPAGGLAATPVTSLDVGGRFTANGGPRAARWGRIGAVSFTPLPPGAESGAAVLCTFDTQAGQIGPDAGDALRVLVRLLAIEREQAAVATRLAEQDAQLVAAFDDAPIGMALVAPDGRWLRVNAALCGIVGRSERELLAGAFQDITHPDDLDADIDHVRHMLNGSIRSYQMTKRYLHADGHAVWTRLDVSLVRDAAGQPRYFVSQIQDISERLRDEAALAASDARLRLALAAASMAA
ncbi:MAG TPA: PAS domain S-box protein, partial [Thermomicrobiales bacterium]|nr:PAS domain S-box protein [Thermomicrobiales bacterium]